MNLWPIFSTATQSLPQAYSSTLVPHSYTRIAEVEITVP